jgi:hypothetical protein
MNIKSHVLFCIITIGFLTHVILEHTRLQTKQDNLDKRLMYPSNHNRSYQCRNTDFVPVHKKEVRTMLTDDPHYVICVINFR